VAEIASLVREIDRRPGLNRVSRIATSQRAYKVSIPQTVKLVKERPELLEKRGDGPIELDGERYWPALVRVRIQGSEPVTVEHMQIACFLVQVIREAEELAGRLTGDQTKQVEDWTNELRGALSVRCLREARARLGRYPGPRSATPLQLRERRYGRLRDLQIEYASQISEGQNWRDSVRANIRDAWDIYQAFVAHAVGKAFSLKHFSPAHDLRERQADGSSMAGNGVSLFYDMKPPPGLLPSWRDGTRRPGSERPDVTLFDSKRGSAIVIDAKFRVAADNKHAMGDDLFEMQGYMDSFGLSSGAIVYPGMEPVPEVVEARSRRLLALPLRGRFASVLGGTPNFESYVANALSGCWSCPSVHQ
jgi:hypothetical protein